MNRYLIPANAKKGQLILNVFRKNELLYIFIPGLAISFFLLVIFQSMLNNTLVAVLCILPGLIACFLCLPIPNYHNVRVLILEIYDFYSTNQKLRWKGWCYLDDSEKK